VNLSEALIHIPQDERGGEIAIRGFEYQRCWAIDELLNRHKKNESYVFIPEYHDDVLILDSSISPTKATFAQVKTKNSHWTINPLITSTSNDKLSFISKLFKHKYDFSSYNVDLMFVSNAFFKFFDSYEFNADELDILQKGTFSNAVKAQLPNFTSSDLSFLNFKTSSLSLMDYDAHLLGKIVAYLDETKILGDVDAMAFKVTLVDIFEKKTRVSSKEIKNFKQLIEKKGISNELIARFITEMKLYESKYPAWEEVNTLLSFIQKDDFEILKLKIKYNYFMVHVKDVYSIEFDFYKSLKNLGSGEKIIATNVEVYIENVITDAIKIKVEYEQLIDDDCKYIMACCAVIDMMSTSGAKK